MTIKNVTMIRVQQNNISIQLLLIVALLFVVTNNIVSVTCSDTSSSSSILSGANIFNNPFTQSFTKLVHAPCTTLFHRNGRIGCGTENHNTVIGWLYYFNGALPQQYSNSNNRLSEEPYVVVIEDYDTMADNIKIISAASGGLLKGILIINSTQISSSSSSSSNSNSNNKDSNTYYSPASQTPGGYNTPMAQLTYGNNAYQWNTRGQNLLDYNFFGIPVAYIPDSDISSSIRQESQRNSNIDKDGNNGGSSSLSNSAIVAEFNYYMGPDEITSKECLQWKDSSGGQQWNPKCLPLGGTSVWASAGSPPNADYANYAANNNNNNNNRELNNEYANQRPVIMLSAGMDSTSMFHDVAPGANTAASNILTILMASKLIGANMYDNVLDALPKRIVFTLFEGESYGYMGSRSFLRDVAYPGFVCNSQPVRSVPRLGQQTDYACLYPLRPSIKFADLGPIAGMIAVDQVAFAVSDGLLFVHADQNNDQYGTYLANILKYSSTNAYSVASTSAGNNNNNGYPYPPSPLTSLLSLSGGAVGGAVLTGYDYAFTGHIPYHSHRDSATIAPISLNAIAAAATLVARAAVAAAYDDGSDDNGGYVNAAAYAKNIIPELDYNDADLIELSNCFFYGSCTVLQKYSDVETTNEKIRTGLNLGSGDPFPNPPSFFVGVYNSYYGQPFVNVGDNSFGAYNGNDFGKKNSDVISMMPRQLENAIHGIFNNYLGRGSNPNNNEAVSCKKSSDCTNQQGNMCNNVANKGDSVTCTGAGQCVCKRAYFHIAVDESIDASPNYPSGYFQFNNYNDNEQSSLYTEPFWSSNVGIRVYRSTSSIPGFISFGIGIVMSIISMFSAFVLKVGLKKEKLY